MEKYFTFDKNLMIYRQERLNKKHKRIILRLSIVKLLKVKEIAKAAEKKNSAHTKEQFKDYQLTSLPK